MRLTVPGCQIQLHQIAAKFRLGMRSYRTRAKGNMTRLFLHPSIMRMPMQPKMRFIANPLFNGHALGDVKPIPRVVNQANFHVSLIGGLV